MGHFACHLRGIMCSTQRPGYFMVAPSSASLHICSLIAASTMLMKEAVLGAYIGRDIHERPNSSSLGKLFVGPSPANSKEPIASGLMLSFARRSESSFINILL